MYDEHEYLEQLDPSYRLVVACGRLVPQKNYPLLLQAFAKARSSNKLKLIILGEGRLRRQIITLAQELMISADVMLTGHITNPYPYMRRSDVFVLTSLWEGMSIVLL